MEAGRKCMRESEPDCFRAIPSAKKGGVINTDGECRPLVLSVDAVKADMTDEATSINHPRIFLLLDVANGGFRMLPRKGGVRVESAAICLDDFLVTSERKAHIHIFTCGPAKDKSGTLELGKVRLHWKFSNVEVVWFIVSRARSKAVPDRNQAVIG